MKILHIVNKVSKTSIPVELAEYMKINNCDVKIISFYDNQNVVNKLKKELNLSVEIYGVGAKGFFDIKAIKYIRKLLKCYESDIINTHHTISGAIVRLVNLIFFKKKVVHTVHADLKSYSFLHNIITGLTIPFTNAIICNSENTKNSFYKWQKTLIKRKKKCVIYNGVDINRITKNIDKNSKLDINSNEIIIGTVGRMVKVKNQETLIKAFSIFNKQVPNCKLIIVGDGPQRETLEALINKLNINDKVIITGMITKDEVYKILSRINIFVITSLYEGFCNALVEAMIAKKSIIATNINPLPEVVGRDNALFFEQKNEVDLQKKIFTLFNDKQLAKNLGEKSYEYASSNYDLAICLKRYINLYKELLD